MEETERRCKTCGVIKPIGDFEPGKRYRNGRMPVCRTCRAAYRAGLYRRERLPIGVVKQCRACAHEKDLSEFVKDRRSPDGYSPRCVDCRRAGRSGESREAARARFLRWKYGISVEDYDAMLQAQGGGCAACGGPQDQAGREWFDIDHCHQTGRVRGLLCSSCNIALGLLREDRERIIRLADYLDRTAPVAA